MEQNIWHSMGFYVGNKLKLDPYEILTTWTCSRLLVTYGVMANQEAKEAHDTWMSAPAGSKPGKKPNEYAVRFYSVKKMQEVVEISNEIDPELKEMYS